MAGSPEFLKVAANLSYCDFASVASSCSGDFLPSPPFSPCLPPLPPLPPVTVSRYDLLGEVLPLPLPCTVDFDGSCSGTAYPKLFPLWTLHCAHSSRVPQLIHSEPSLPQHLNLHAQGSLACHLRCRSRGRALPCLVRCRGVLRVLPRHAVYEWCGR